jgi:hypothetical protein
MFRPVRPLNIEVPDSLVRRWVEWFAPNVQPFIVDKRSARELGKGRDVSSLPAELTDTYQIYALPPGHELVWLSEARFADLPRSGRAALVRAQRTCERELVPTVRAWAPVLGRRAGAQADGHRFVWWPSLLAGHENRVLTEFIEEGRFPSSHDEVPERVWARLQSLLPGVRRLAGTFADRSGPNCFGTVMAAAGVAGAEDEWMQREPFERWLSESTRPGGRDTDAGTVLVWRGRDGSVQHAAVTLGEGWAFHKPSQGWMSPRKVLTVEQTKKSARSVGWRLQRYAIA